MLQNIQSSVLFILLVPPGAALPTRHPGSEAATVPGGDNQPAERCCGHTLLQPAGPPAGSGVLREAQPGLPAGDRQRVPGAVSSQGVTLSFVADIVL